MQNTTPWPVSLDVPVAWGEMDAFAHVNNTVFLRWFESARIALFERAGMLARMEAEKIGPILARTEVDYRRPVTYPDQIRVDACVLSLGSTSFVMGYRVASRALGAIVAEGKTVIVLFDYRAGRKVPLDDGLRASLGTLLGS